jgi:hypothetical protein
MVTKLKTFIINSFLPLVYVIPAFHYLIGKVFQHSATIGMLSRDYYQDFQNYLIAPVFFGNLGQLTDSDHFPCFAVWLMN